ncbi:MAG: 4Fe-4S binding protein [Desulfamplus sp.]|nr:4Fe-4S binding protein [Desulfamplus sp.]
MQLTAINNNCSGCGTCKLACSIENYRETSPSKAVLKIVGLFPSPGKYEIYLCDQCGECAKVCPVEAIQADENGVYTVNKDECISCMACVDACPKGVMMTHKDFENPFKCTLCMACVDACPRDAIILVDENRAATQEIQKEIA